MVLSVLILLVWGVTSMMRDMPVELVDPTVKGHRQVPEGVGAPLVYADGTPAYVLVRQGSGGGGGRVRLIRQGRVFLVNPRRIRGNPGHDIKLQPGDQIEMPQTFFSCLRAATVQINR